MAVQEDELVSIGELLEERAPTKAENKILNRLKILAKANLPEGWTKFKVRRASREEIFGDEIDANVLKKLTFALPTISMVKAFDPEADRLSERGYRDICVKMMDWAFTRALILGPPAIANQVRGSAARTEFFKEAVSSLKPLLYTREEADRILSGALSTSEGTKGKRKSTSSCVSASSSQKKTRDDLMGDKIDSKLIVAMKQLESMSREAEPNEGEISDEGSSEADWQAPPFNSSLTEDADFDFKPNVKIADPSMPEPSPEVMAEGIECQGLGTVKWSRIRYEEAKKTLEAAPVFSTLKVNNELANLNLPCDPLLAQHDGILGAICHGFLLQRKALLEGFKNVVEKHPEAKEHVRKILTNSKFQALSDDLLQFACGRRAAIIEERRKIFKANNEALTAALHQIPPSSTHLFEEESLANFLKDCGGVNRVFPSRQGRFPNRKRNSFRKPSRASGSHRQRNSTGRTRARNSSSSSNRNPRRRGSTFRTWHRSGSF